MSEVGLTDAALARYFALSKGDRLRFVGWLIASDAARALDELDHFEANRATREGSAA